MEPQKLIKKIDDRDAVSILIGRYGNKIYARLYEKLRDKQLADEAFRKTMFSFLETVKRLESDDLTEALFSCIADNVCLDMQSRDDAAKENVKLVREPVCPQEAPSPAISEAICEKAEPAEIAEVEAVTEVAETAEPEKPEEPAEPEAAEEPDEILEPAETPSKAMRGFEIAVLLLLIFIVVVLIWIVAGIAMQSGLIPTVDFGYSWFDRNVFPLFFEYGVF